MYKPTLKINTRKLKENTQAAIKDLNKFGVSMMAVNKVFNGAPETAQAVVDAGINVIAESRVYNLAKMQHIDCLKCLLRSPVLSEIEDVIRYSDLSLNSEETVIRALAAEAQKQGCQHGVLLMIDLGDLREGVWFENYDDILQLIKLIQALDNIYLYGIGSNFNCYGTVLPTVTNGDTLVSIKERLEVDLGQPIPLTSAGNCTSYHLMDKGTWPAGLDHLRMGGLQEFGIEYVDMKYLDDYHHSHKDVGLACSDMYILSAEIIEVNAKPTVPVGELGVDAFLNPKEFEDKGIRKRALLAFGLQDVPFDGCHPVDDKISLLGQTSDHTLIDIEDSEQQLQVGDCVEFELDYTALLMACQTTGIKYQFTQE
ncbi:alanine/ornithine racemase family PLP-dependent enzyme [Photobacterium kishitanii]|uniref:alanine/ornithine racemase family PLP-dependent enzyme n=1 Tax=Photobacterium kishitanii TaxID=318456 RepID=UPI0005D2DDDD|nr:alanine/ornithine racemase family PLP-dependent enzyme [Photobacterium kishitanii]KJG09503.1 amino acid racemase [Photobacterium kishitanii]OBU29656.1 amino-acid racemase [Photobacterium kishitanii]PSV07850.1 alanine/ornithine racemase family PLP-dependent enzyme [Photobacterium kishitanii]PSV76338.1 alanine/ornithine racemase family PLP-dependent enzyme [Photobacterium kishitanii]PSW49448.1 alanine/ornithine racemase family PLP-dependent enzyme [Photobacterium kishitanii]